MGCNCLKPGLPTTAVLPTSSVVLTDAYDAIRFTLSRKGLLRKLLEHLSSHRQFIPDSIDYISKIIKKCHDTRNATIGLVVIDQVLINNYHTLFLSNNAPMSLTTNGNSVHSNRNLQSQHLVVQEPSSTRSLSFSKKVSKKWGEWMHGSTRDRTSNSEKQWLGRFEAGFFQLAMLLFDQQTLLRKRVLESVCSLSRKSKDKFSSIKPVEKFMSHLITVISEDYKQAVECSATYFQLLEKSLIGEIQTQAVQVFVQAWLRASPNDPLRRNIYSILKTCTRNYSSASYSAFYEILLDVYDSRRFVYSDELKNFEKYIVKGICDEQDTPQFHRGLFRYLLSYLQVMSQESENRVSVDLSGYISKFPGILDTTSKANGFDTLTRWVANGFVEINQLLQYSATSVASCIAVNLLCSNPDSSMILSSIERWIEALSKACGYKSQFMLLEALIWELKDVKTPDATQQESLANLLRVVSNMMDLMLWSSEDYDQETVLGLLQPLPQHKHNASVVLQIYSKLLNCALRPKEQYSQIGVSMICEFIYSLLQNCNQPEQTDFLHLQFYLSYIESVEAFIRAASINHLSEISTACIQLISQLRAKKFRNTAERFLLLYLELKLLSSFYSVPSSLPAQMVRTVELLKPLCTTVAVPPLLLPANKTMKSLASSQTTLSATGSSAWSAQYNSRVSSSSDIVKQMEQFLFHYALSNPSPNKPNFAASNKHIQILRYFYNYRGPGLRSESLTGRNEGDSNIKASSVMNTDRDESSEQFRQIINLIAVNKFRKRSSSRIS